MDARGVQRLLERIQGLAETAEHVGNKYEETMQREPRLSDSAKGELGFLYKEHAIRLVQLHVGLGLLICDRIESELEDESAREMVRIFRANFELMRENARTRMTKEIGLNSKLLSDGE